MEDVKAFSKRPRIGAQRKSARKKARGDRGVVYRSGARALSAVAVPRQTVSDNYHTEDLVYSEHVELKAVASSVSNAYEFRLNSAYDPDYSGGGHQPRGFDQWAAFYRRYRVTQVKINVQFSSPANAFGNPALAWIHVGNGSYGLTPSITLLETPGTCFKTVDVQEHPRLQQTVKLWELGGMTYKQYMADDSTAASTGANPAMIAIGSVGVVSANNSSAVQTTQAQITMVMRVVFFEKLSPVAS